jgi:lysylphosphatidylglycerol synthetase-like protein (DUF2156 family)
MINLILIGIAAIPFILAATAYHSVGGAALLLLIATMAAFVVGLMPYVLIFGLAGIVVGLLFRLGRA